MISQMISRLFPFSRGVNHAYWAANVWALYTGLDRVLLFLVRKKPGFTSNLSILFSIDIDQSSMKSASRGLIGDTTFSILPTPTPLICFILTLVPILIYLIKLWLKPTFKNFLSSIILCGFSSFLFGWHVHEKAILLVLIPLTFLANSNYENFRTFQLLTVCGVFGLFPLLFDGNETIIKLVYTFLWCLIVFGNLKKSVYRTFPGNLSFLIHGFETLYLLGFFLLQVYVSLLHPIFFRRIPDQMDSKDLISKEVQDLKINQPLETTSSDSTILDSSTEKFQEVFNSAAEALGLNSSKSDTISSEKQVMNSMEFLPLMMISVYCSIGVIWCWLRFSFSYLLDEVEIKERLNRKTGEREREREREKKRAGLREGSQTAESQQIS